MKITIYKDQKSYISRYYDLTNSSVNELEKSLKDHCELVTVDPFAAAIEVEAYSPNRPPLIVKGTATPMSLRNAALDILDLYGREFTREEGHGSKGKFTKSQFIALCVGTDTLRLKELKAELKNLFDAWYGGSKPEKKHDPGTPMSHEDFSMSVYFLSDQIYLLENQGVNCPDCYEKDWKNYLENAAWQEREVTA